MRHKTLDAGDSNHLVSNVMGKIRPGKHSWRRRRASTLIEFALIVPVLLAVVMGIIEFGWLVRSQLMIANAAREGARYAAVGKQTTDIVTRINNMASGIPGAPASLTITIKRNDGANGTTYNTNVGNTGTTNNAPTGSMIQVRVSAPNRSLTGLFPFLNNRTVQAAVVMRREA